MWCDIALFGGEGAFAHVISFTKKHHVARAKVPAEAPSSEPRGKRSHLVYPMTLDMRL